MPPEVIRPVQRHVREQAPEPIPLFLGRVEHEADLLPVGELSSPGLGFPSETFGGVQLGRVDAEQANSFLPAAVQLDANRVPVGHARDLAAKLASGRVGTADDEAQHEGDDGCGDQEEGNCANERT